MRKVPPLSLLFPTRSGDEWLVVGEKERRAWLKASVGNNPDQPPTNGWKFFKKDDYVDDPSLSCTLPISTSSCILTVVLTNMEDHAECAGVYKATGLVSLGREVEAVLSLI